jgi:seryl-tRNA synthetase
VIDVKLLRTEPERVRESLKRRGTVLDLNELIEVDERYRRLLSEVEKLRAEQNKASKEVARVAGSEREAAISSLRELSDRLKALEIELQGVQAERDDQLAHVPNFVHPEVPEGSGEENNVVIKEVGERRTFDFEPRDHMEIGEALDIIDVARAAKVSGSRFGILKGDAAIIELALVRFAMDRLREEGFLPVIPPVLVRHEALYGSGFLPGDEAQAYVIPKDELYLVGTSEVSLVSMHMNEILPNESLPLSYAGFSSCFRREAGTYGKDTRGIIRVHQFDKVEMFIFCHVDQSEQQHERLLDLEQRLYRSLEIPYRVVDTCAGDLGAPYYRKFDIEAWLPGPRRWLEITSCSNALDYQARRLGIRTKTEQGSEFVHTLNGTALAVGRSIVALLENHQQADGSVTIPEALRAYAGFEKIGP